MTPRRPTVVVLAAGRGSRFGGPGHKLEQPLGEAFNGDSLLAISLRHAIATRLRVVVVTTPMLAPLALRQLAARDVVVMKDRDASGQLVPVGMGHSIAAGVGAAGDADGWLILPADMPLIQPASVLAVAEALEQYPVCYAQHRGRQGHPVGFSTELYSELMALRGDEGARRIVGRYPSFAVEVDDPGVLVDLDTEADFHRVLNQVTDLPT
jgi:molybdenum cofactor cytidylyltransferase